MSTSRCNTASRPAASSPPRRAVCCVAAPTSIDPSVFSGCQRTASQVDGIARIDVSPVLARRCESLSSSTEINLESQCSGGIAVCGGCWSVLALASCCRCSSPTPSWREWPDRVLADACRPATAGKASRRTDTAATSAHVTRGAAARRSLSLIASPSPCPGIGMTAMAWTCPIIERAQGGKEIGRRLDEIAGRAEVDRRAARRRHVGVRTRAGPRQDWHCVASSRTRGARRVVLCELAGRAWPYPSMPSRARAASRSPPRSSPRGWRRGAAAPVPRRAHR